LVPVVAKSPSVVKDTFLYHPRLKAMEEAEVRSALVYMFGTGTHRMMYFLRQTVVACGEPIEVRFVLQNPFGFDLDIRELRME
jgi:hypothetical protein